MSAQPLHYLVHEPAGPVTHPRKALFLLHGYGSNAQDLFGLAKPLKLDAVVFSLQAPYDLAGQGFAWYAIHFDEQQGKWSDDQQALSSVEQIDQMITQLIEEYHLDPEELHLGGFSQGAILSYALAFQKKGRFRSIAGLSGYINERITPLGPMEINVFASHGTQDQVIPFSWAESIQQQLNLEGCTLKFCTYPTGHSLCMENFEDLIQWMRHYIGSVASTSKPS